MKKLISKIKSLRKKLGDLRHTSDSCNESNIKKDLAGIEISSKMLQMSEFRFFQLAYERWYGSELAEGNMENIFADYMFKNEVPYWVRHLSRNVLSLYFEDRLDPREFNINCTIAPSQTENSESFSAILLFFTYLVFYLILSGQIVFQ